MRRVIILAAGLACLTLSAGAMADGVYRITGYDAPKHYDMATGEILEQGAYGTRAIGRPLWAMNEPYAFAVCPDGQAWVDCADMEMEARAQTFGFAYVTNCQEGTGDITLWLPLYTGENNHDSSATRELVATLVLDNLPGSTHPVNEYWGSTWTGTFISTFLFDGADLDADGLQDFGYQYIVKEQPAGLVGIPNGGEPNVYYPLGAGAEDGWDVYEEDANGLGIYLGYYDFEDPNLLGQFYFEAYAPGCPNAGPSGRYCTADIAGDDCIVNVSDLAHLLGNYGMTTGAVMWDGDIDPYDPLISGDGDVDLGDLAELLTQYGDDCNW